MKSELRILLVGDSEDDTLLYLNQIKKGGYEIYHERVETAKAFVAALNKKNWDIILSDFTMPHFSGLEALMLSNEIAKEIPFIIISGTIGEEVAVEAMKTGASDYILKTNLKRLLPVVERELQVSENRSGNRLLKQKQKLTEEALQASEKRFQSLYENIKIGLYRTRPDGTILMANSALLTMLGYASFNELAKRKLNKEGFELNQQRKEFLDAIEKDGEVENFESTWIRKDRSPVFVRESARAIRDAKGRTLFYDGTAEDITEQKQAKETLQKMNARHAAMISNIGDVIAIIGADAMNRYQSPNIEKWFGWKPEDMLVGVAWDYVHPEDVERVQQEFSKILEKVSASIVEFRFKCKDGSYKWIEMTALNRIKDPAINGVLLNYHDITERKKGETALKESEARYRSLFEASADGIQMVDIETKMFKYANPALCRMLGYSAEELEKMRMDDIHPKEDMQRIITEFQSVISGDKTIAHDIPCLRKDGNIVYADINSADIIINERPYKMGIFRDITERKQAAQLIRQKNEFLQLILDSLTHPFYVINVSDYTVSIANSTALSGQLAAGLTCHALTHKRGTPCSSSEHPCPVEIIKRTKKAVTLEHTHYDQDGNERNIEVHGHPIFDSKGNVHQVIEYAIDITERKEAEAEVKLKNEQLIKVNAEKDIFFSIIAHDLRSPFGGFLGFTELLVNELPNLSMDKIQRYIVAMRDSAVNLNGLLEDLLQWARQQQGLIPFKPNLIQLHSVVNESIEVIMGSAKIKDIEIDTEIPANLGVFADEIMIQTIIRNLVSNALKFTPRQGKISLLARKTDEEGVEIAIKDTGIGMDSKMLKNIFQINVNTNRKGTDGEHSTGVGLLLCKEFVEKHGGTIWAESEEKDLPAGIIGGTTMYFTINNQPLM